MWIRASGPLGEQTFQLTTAVSSHLLIVGEKTALVDASISAVSERLIEEVKAYLPAGKALDYLLLTHGHFDHVGGTPAIRAAFPNLQVWASRLTQELLADREQVGHIAQRNITCQQAMGQESTSTVEDWANAFHVEHIVRDGDMIALGSQVEVKVITAPGHTEDSVCYFVRPDGAIAGGEALGGFHGRGKISSAFMSGYEDYISNFLKLSNLELEIISFPHSGALTGQLAKNYLTLAQQAAEQLREQIKLGLANGEVVGEVCNRLLPEFVEQGVVAEGPFREMVEESMQRMVQVVAEEL